MRPARPLAVALALSSLVLVPVGAVADIPPPDRCETVGQACNNAVDGGATGLRGTCRATTCSRWAPGGGNLTYACNLCVPTAGGGGSTGGSSCSVAAPGSTRSGGALSAGLALLAFACSRRTRRVAPWRG